MTKELVEHKGIILKPSLIDLVGRRYKTLDLLKKDIKTISHRIDINHKSYRRVLILKISTLFL